MRYIMKIDSYYMYRSDDLYRVRAYVHKAINRTESTKQTETKQTDRRAANRGAALTGRYGGGIIPDLYYCPTMSEVD